MMQLKSIGIKLKETLMTQKKKKKKTAVLLAYTLTPLLELSDPIVLSLQKEKQSDSA